MIWCCISCWAARPSAVLLVHLHAGQLEWVFVWPSDDGMWPRLDARRLLLLRRRCRRRRRRGRWGSSRSCSPSLYRCQCQSGSGSAHRRQFMQRRGRASARRRHLLVGRASRDALDKHHGRIPSRAGRHRGGAGQRGVMSLLRPASAACCANSCFGKAWRSATGGKPLGSCSCRTPGPQHSAVSLCNCPLSQNPSRANPQPSIPACSILFPSSSQERRTVVWHWPWQRDTRTPPLFTAAVPFSGLLDATTDRPLRFARCQPLPRPPPLSRPRHVVV